MVTLSNNVFDRAGFTLLGTHGTLKILAKFSNQIKVKTNRKDLPSEREALGTVPYVNPALVNALR